VALRRPEAAFFRVQTSITEYDRLTIPESSANIHAMATQYDVLLDALLTAYGPRLKTVVLFGSRARGDASPNSDHDIFAVIDGLPAGPGQGGPDDADQLPG
jgi:hypothetical protein